MKIWGLVDSEAFAACTPLPPPLAATNLATTVNVSAQKEAPDRADRVREGEGQGGWGVEPGEWGRAFDSFCFFRAKIASRGVFFY